MSSPDAGLDANPYAPPVESSSVVLQTRGPISFYAFAAWLTGVAAVQIAISTWTVHYLRRPIAAMNINSAYVHLGVSIVLAICAAIHLTRRYQSKPAIVLAELVNLTQWIVFPATVVALKRSDITDVSLSWIDIQIFFAIWLGSSVLIVGPWWILCRRLQKHEEAGI